MFIGRYSMKFLKGMVLILAFLTAVGIGVYMCTDFTEADKIEEAVLI